MIQIQPRPIEEYIDITVSENLPPNSGRTARQMFFAITRRDFDSSTIRVLVYHEKREAWVKITDPTMMKNILAMASPYLHNCIAVVESMKKGTTETRNFCNCGGKGFGSIITFQGRYYLSCTRCGRPVLGSDRLTAALRESYVEPDPTPAPSAHQPSPSVEPQATNDTEVAEPQQVVVSGVEGTESTSSTDSGAAAEASDSNTADGDDSQYTYGSAQVSLIPSN